jgi:hypothetical protein
MPQIPTAAPVQNTPYGMINPSEAGAPGAAIARAGQQGERLAQFGLQVAETVQKHEDQLKTLQFQTGFRADLHSLAQQLKMDPDDDGMLERYQVKADELRKKYEDTYSSNQRIWPYLNEHLEQRTQEFNDAVLARQFDIRKIKAATTAGVNAKDAVEDAVMEQDPIKRRAIIAQAQLENMALASTGLISPERAEQLNNKMPLQVEWEEVKRGTTSDDPLIVQAMIARLKSPGSFPKILENDPKEIPIQLESAEKRLDALKKLKEKKDDEVINGAAYGKLQDKFSDPQTGILDATAAMALTNSKQWQIDNGYQDDKGTVSVERLGKLRTAIRGMEATQTEAIKQAHDKETKELGNLFVKEKYNEILNRLGPNSLQTGTEERTWKNEINAAIKSKTDIQKEARATRAAAAIITANEMIRHGDDPIKINRYISANADMDKTDKEQYINKLEAKMGKEVEEGRKLGYADIKDIIIPPARSMSLEALIQTPQQTRQIKEAQMALDSWIDRQYKDNKPMSRNDIRIQAQQFASEYSSSTKERVQQLMDSMNKAKK